jgi:hypothetical protein
MFLLDTDHLGILQRRTRPEIDRLLPRINAHPAAHFFVSIVSFHEQVLGWNSYISRAPNPAGTVRGYQMFLQLLAELSARTSSRGLDRITEAVCCCSITWAIGGRCAYLRPAPPP